MQAVATTYLGCGLPPAGSLTPSSCCFLDLSEAQISEVRAVVVVVVVAVVSHAVVVLMSR